MSRNSYLTVISGTAFLLLAGWLSACDSYKNDPDDSCKRPEYSVEYPDFLKTWLTAPPFAGKTTFNVKTYSSTGLSESMNVKYSTGYYSKYGGRCDPVYKYESHTFTYSSSLYNHSFNIIKEFVLDLETYTHIHIASFDEPEFKVDPDSAHFIIEAPYALIRFPKEPESSGRVSTPVGIPVYPYSGLSVCENCYEYIGSFTVRGKVFNEVARFKNKYSEAGSPVYFWVDKEYGVVQFQLRDSTTWHFDYN